MTTFLGPVGSLIPVKCASRLAVAGGREVSFTRTLGKQKAFLGQVRAREWDVEIGVAKPHELSGLQYLAEYSDGPLVWYPDDATSGNILTPAQSALTPSTHDGFEGPLIEISHNMWLKSGSPNGSALAITRADGGRVDTPVVQGHPVSVSVFLQGNTLSGRQMIRVIWRDAQGGNLSTVDTNFDVSESFSRRSVTLIPPLGAAQVNTIFYAAQVAGPAVTLTDRVMPYSLGKGAHQVVAHGLGEAVLRAHEDQQYRSLSFTFSEVG